MMTQIRLLIVSILFCIVSCNSTPKITKLEAALDEIISKYDTASFEYIPQEELGLTIYYKTGSVIHTNKDLLNELKTFCKTFFSDPQNFDDLVFCRYNDIYSDVEFDKDFCIIDTTQLVKYKFIASLIIKDAPYEKFRIKNAQIHKLLNFKNDYSVFILMYNNKIIINFPLLELQLSNAKYEEL